MNEAVEAVRTGQVTEAVRAVTMNGVRVEQGMIVGMLEREVVAAGEDVEAVVRSLVEAAQDDEIELVTLYRGEPILEADAQRIAESLGSDVDDIEIELVEGGQPHYHFLISME
jgi:dihydroxyacetone kinase-like predicted kinase